MATNIFDVMNHATLDDLKAFDDLRSVINTRNTGGGTPLFIAVFKAISDIYNREIDTNLPIIEYLISKGADVNIKYPDGQTILLIALRMGANSAVIKLLVDNGADVDEADDKGYKQSALHSTAENIDLDSETTELIVSKSENIDLQDVYGNTPLHQACMVGNVKMAELLLNYGANIDMPNKTKGTPLHAAVAKSHIECAGYLISKGADVDAGDEDDWTPLHWAAKTGNVEIARILIQKGHADINARTYKGNTALTMAKQFGHYSLESYLSSKTY